MVTKKIGKPPPRASAQRAAPAVARARSHTLAPPHLGEAASAAVLVVAVLGLAVFIAGVAMTVSGMTIANRFGESPPPNVGELGIGQVLGGIGLAALGIFLSGSSLAVLADVPGSRPIVAAASGLTAALCALGVVLVQLEPGGNFVLGIALVVAAVVFAGAAIILVRRRA